MLVILIGYHETTGDAIDGDVFQAEDDREACRKALAWVAHEASTDVGGWRAFESLKGWGAGREIKPEDDDYNPRNRFQGDT